jgi:ribosomal protein L12E/L44/L45/RPP1/RPP2
LSHCHQKGQDIFSFIKAWNEEKIQQMIEKQRATVAAGEAAAAAAAAAAENGGKVHAYIHYTSDSACE